MGQKDNNFIISGKFLRFEHVGMKNTAVIQTPSREFYHVELTQEMFKNNRSAKPLWPAFAEVSPEPLPTGSYEAKVLKISDQ